MALQLHVTLLEQKSASPKLRYSIFREILSNAFLQVGGVSLKQVERLYLGVAFTSDGRQDEELDVRSGKASAVMRGLHHSVVLKWELSRKAKLSVIIWS